MTGQILIGLGTMLTAAGLAGIVWCAGKARAARRLGDEAMRAALARLVPVHLGALAGATIGLICVIIGIVLR